MSAGPGIWVVVLIAFFLAVGFPLMHIGVPSLTHQSVSPHHFGRVFSLWRQFAEAVALVFFVLVGRASRESVEPHTLTKTAFQTLPR